MGKKDRKKLDGMKAQFIGGATALGLAQDKLEKVWTDWEAFAQYAFNKSHSTCYAFVAYQTGYLKAHYPSEYMSAVLNHAGDISKITFFMEECRRMGIKVLGPDINESWKGFAPNPKGEIRFGLGGLKGVGEAAIESIIEERGINGKFNTVIDFIKRINQRTVNKKSLESLVYSGAFDTFTEYHRAQYFAIPKGEKETGLEKIVKYGNMLQTQSQTTTNTLFGNLHDTMVATPPKLALCEPWTLTELLEHEKEVTGMFMSGHPLNHFNFELKHYGIISINEVTHLMTDEDTKPNVNRLYKIAGLVTGAMERTTKSGKNYGNLNIEDYSGKMELTMWSNDYAKFSPFFKPGLTINVNGYIKPRMRYNGPEQVQDGWEFKVTQIQMLESLRDQHTKAIELNIHPANLKKGMIDFLAGQFRKPGPIGVKLKLRDRERNYDIEFSTPKGIKISDELAAFLLENQEIETKIVIAGE
jgi:DNA polymerase-3 subunit alpha